MGRASLYQLKQKRTRKAMGQSSFVASLLAREEAIFSLFLSKSRPGFSGPWVRSWGSSLLHSQSLSPLVLYPVTLPSRFLIERVRGIGLALGSLNTGTPQTIHSQLLPQAHPSLVPSFPQCSPPSEKPAPPSSGHPGFARLGGSEGAKEPGRGFAQVENNDRSKYTPG